MRGDYGPNRPYTAPIWPTALVVLAVSIGGTAAILWGAVGLAHVIAAHKGPALAALLAAGWLGYVTRPRKRGRRR